ncbi:MULTISPECIES: diacylglycerol kinase [Desulfobacter]|jgi:diacylglycerol kinase (ATP)|uniref:diacylglycerol kinase n=1 Tax=Desulfobacter TaxID=2289 RepID=UPI00257E9302|nr:MULTISPECIES: diacylglycerol kinase [Desulfobacter]MDX9962803.1 diacylglycerol kinase [Desulfobacter postgatei]
MKKETGIIRLIKAAGYSLEGLKTAWFSEAAFRQETFAAVVLVPAALFLGQDGTQKVLLAVPPLIVLVAELLNSGLEAVVDRIGTDFHPLAKQAKDMGSAAVFVSILITIMAWTLILI